MRAIQLAVTACAAAAVVAFGPAGAPAAMPPVPAQRVRSDKWPADRLEFVGDSSGASAIYEIPDAPGISETGRIAVSSDPNDKTADLHFGLSPRLSGGAHAEDPWWEADFSYKLRPGETVPMLGAVYSVREISMNPLRVKLERVTDADLLKQFDLHSGSTAIPLGCSAVFSFSNPASELAGENLVKVKSVAAGGADGSAPVARISTGAMVQPRKETSVKEGDQIELVDHCKLRVVKIVGPDKNRGIAGWIEFSPDRPKKDEKAEQK